MADKVSRGDFSSPRESDGDPSRLGTRVLFPDPNETTEDILARLTPGDWNQVAGAIVLRFRFYHPSEDTRAPWRAFRALLDPKAEETLVDG